LKECILPKAAFFRFPEKSWVNHFFCVISDEAMDGDQRQPMLSQQRYIK